MRLTTLGRLPGLKGGAAQRHLTAHPQRLCTVRPLQQQASRTVTRRALEPSLVDWLSSYGVHSKELLVALERAEAHTCADLQHLQKEDMELLEAEGSGVQLSRLRAAIKGDAYLRRWQEFTDRIGGSSLAAWAARSPAATPLAAAAPAAPASAAPTPARPTAAASLLQTHVVGEEQAAEVVSQGILTAKVAAVVATPPAVVATAPADGTTPPSAPAWCSAAALARPPVALRAGSAASKIAFSPCGTYLAVGLHTGIVEIWDVLSGVLEAALIIDATLVNSEDEGDDSDESEEEEVEGEDGAEGDDATSDCMARVTSVSWNVDGRSLLVSTLTEQSECALSLLHVPQHLLTGTGPDAGSVRGPPSLVVPDPDDTSFDSEDCLSTATLSPDGRTMAAVTRNGYFYVWDLVRGNWTCSGCVAFQLEDERAWPLALCACPDSKHPDGKRLLAAVGSMSGVAVWDLSQRHIFCEQPDVDDCTPLACEESDPDEMAAKGGKRVLSLSASADGQRLAAGHKNGKIAIYDMTEIGHHDDGTSDAIFTSFSTFSGGRHYCAPVNAVALTPCGGGVISASKDGSVTAWDADSGKVTATLQPSRPRAALGLAVSLDGKQVAAVFARGDMAVWQLK